MDLPVRTSLDTVSRNYGTLPSSPKTPNDINPDLLKLEGDREVQLSLLKDQGFTVFDPSNFMDVENAYMAFSENCPNSCSKSDFTTALKELMFQAKEAIKPNHREANAFMDCSIWDSWFSLASWIYIGGTCGW